MAANRNRELGTDPTRRANETRSQSDLRSEKGNSRNQGNTILTLAQNMGSRFEILGDTSEENHIQSSSERQTLSGKESDGGQNMENETPNEDGEVLKENLPVFTAMESHQVHPQIFAFTGRKTTKNTSSSSFPHTPLAPKNNRIIGPIRPSQTLLSTRGPTQGGSNQHQQNGDNHVLRSPLKDLNKPYPQAILTGQQPLLSPLLNLRMK